MKYIIDEETLSGLANAIRKINGEDRTYTATEMIEAVTNIMDSAVYILVDEDGNEMPAVYVDSEVDLNATANDIRIGTTAVNNDGIVEGEKEIPAYHTTEGVTLVPGGSTFTIPLPLNRCEYTKLQALICKFNTTLNDSVSTDRVVIENLVYETNSIDSISEVIIDLKNSHLNLGITNDRDVLYMIRYFTYKEEQ